MSSPSPDPTTPPTTTVAEIQQLDDGSRFEGVYLLRRRQEKSAKNGNSFLALEFSDRSGDFNSVVWQDSAAFAFFSELKEGTVLHVSGLVNHYQGRLSPRVEKAEVMSEEAAAPYLSGLIAVAPIPVDELKADLAQAIAEIQRPAMRRTVEIALEETGEAFYHCPGAIKMHHAYRHGLLEHTVRMVRATRALLPLYPEVDPDLALAGVILHDIGKVTEYSFDTPEGTEPPLAPRHSRAGLLQGHVVLGYRTVRRAAMLAQLDEALTERLEHIILSHQGKLEYGAAALVGTPEAVFVSYIDCLDAFMGMAQHALRQGPAQGEEFSEFIPGIGNRLLLTPPPAIISEEGREETEEPQLPEN